MSESSIKDNHDPSNIHIKVQWVDNKIFAKKY